MQLPRQSIESCVSRGTSIYALDGVLFDAEAGLLVATNGHILAAIPAKPCKGDQTGIISTRAWRMARSAVRRIPRKMRTKVSASFQILKHRIVVRGLDETTVLPKLTGNFPKWRSLFTTFKPKTRITLNVELLSQLSEALCDPSMPPLVTLFIDGPGTAFGVVAEYGDGVGVMMPVRSESPELKVRLSGMGIESK